MDKFTNTPKKKSLYCCVTNKDDKLADLKILQKKMLQASAVISSHGLLQDCTFIASEVVRALRTWIEHCNKMKPAERSPLPS